MEENIFPSGGFLASESDIEEERRLFYVGMTRAKTSLSIYSVKSINEKESVISRFVSESKKKKEEEM